ncbi:MAG TPA: glycosyltransferase family 4 protein [Candidatus Bathyarchaeia archaeon]|nr:glycosyltransferase family 4 protein [Candidatus Bathyarchaeia archaeon]
MKDKTFSGKAVDALRILRQNGVKSLADPLATFREYIEETRYRNTIASIRKVDCSDLDLAENRELMSRFDKMKNLNLKTINWFVPCFNHPYGGIYTILRFANYFSETKGVRNNLIICGDPRQLSTNPSVQVDKVFPKLSEGLIILGNNNVESLPESDVCIATDWTSAYYALKYNKTKGKFYFIQDYEPLFFPAGSMFALAEATYRFGFRGITNTPSLYNIYVHDYSGIAEYFVPSVDPKVFFPSQRKPHKPSVENPFNVFFYARPSVPRNGFELGALALDAIKKRYGNTIKIYAAGANWNPRTYKLEKTITNLGVLPYERTGELYRNCDLGLVFMFTKHPSYLPFELMACSCPVLTNFNPATTWFLKDRTNCVLTEPTPTSICQKIESLMNDLELRKDLISNGLIEIQKGNWEKEIEKIYAFVCNSSKI